MQARKKGSFVAPLLDFDPTGSYLTGPNAVQQKRGVAGA
jgi:hypothetical protein